MADDFASRTEAPTPRRREEAREQGQVAFSAELVTGVLLLAGAEGQRCGTGKQQHAGHQQRWPSAPAGSATGFSARRGWSC